MSKSVLEKIKKLRESRPQPQNWARHKDIFYEFQKGDNPIRLVGEFLQQKIHFIAPNKRFKDRGLCIADAFEGEDRIPKMISCLDWNTDEEQPTAEKTCPICHLHRIVKKVLREGGSSVEPQDRQYLEKLQKDSGVGTSLKWNVIDRRDPHVTEVDENGNEKKVLGYKVINIGMEAWYDIDSIFRQLDRDISDPEEGVDINIIQDHNGVRTCYSAQVVMDGVQAKCTPLTEAERQLTLHDLKRLVGRQISAKQVIDALHDDIREILADSGVTQQIFEAEARKEAQQTQKPQETKEEEPQSDFRQAPAGESDSTSEPVQTVQTEPKKTEEPQKKLPPLSEDFGFGEIGEGVKEQAESQPESQSKEQQEAQEEQQVQWECFGTIEDENHEECSKCASKEQCLAEAAKRKSEA